MVDGETRDEGFYRVHILKKFKNRVGFIKWAIPKLQVLRISLIIPYVEFGKNGKMTILDEPDYSSGCTALTALDAPSGRYVYASGCAALTALDAPATLIILV